MIKTIKSIVITVVLLCIALIVSACSGTDNSIGSMVNQTAQSMKAISKAENILSDEEMLPAGNSSGDWTAMTLAFSDVEDDYNNYLSRLQEYVGRQYGEQGYLHRVKATEYHRIALTMLALGKDPSQIEYNGRTINLIADGTYNFHAGSPGLQGANGLIYALLSLDSKDYTVPKGYEYTREAIVSDLLSYQSSEGGFALDKSLDGDVDITAMAVQALAKYRDREDVKTAVDKAVHWLSQQMTENMMFMCYGAENTESCAQVILALCALGTDPAESIFSVDGKSIIDGMNSLRMKDGLYKHTAEDSEYNHMSTYQALLALEAVEQLRNGEGWIFDFTEYTAPQDRQ